MTEVEFVHTALHSYDNIQCSTVDEFDEDLNRIIVVRKMLARYQATQKITTRLVLNHLVILFNVFGAKTLDLLLHKIPKEHYNVLFPFLILLEQLPEEKLELCNQLDASIINELRSL